TPPRRSVAFVAFADEEHGFLGSSAYCRRHPDRLASTVGMVNLDALAWAFPAGRSIHVDPSIADFVAERAARRGWVADEVRDASHMTASDHNPFIDAGVPACWLWRYPPQHIYYHSAGDTLEALDFDLVADTADAATY